MAAESRLGDGAMTAYHTGRLLERFRWSTVAAAATLAIAGGCQAPWLVSPRFEGKPSPALVTLPDSGPEDSPDEVVAASRPCICQEAAACRCRSARTEPRATILGRQLRCRRPILAGHKTGMGGGEPYIEPPHSKFHPVPTAPVFGPRGEYPPPQPMVPAHRVPPLRDPSSGSDVHSVMPSSLRILTQ